MEAAFIAFGGIVLGAALSEALAWWREHRTEGKAARRVRTMLSVEIEQNLALLREYRQDLERWPDADLVGYMPEEDEEPLYYAARVLRLPLPVWRRVMWDSQLPDLATSLSRDQIRQCHLHHSGLDTVASAKNTMVQLWQSQMAERHRRKEAGEDQASINRNASYYLDLAPELWAKCGAAIEAVIQSGNPLDPDAAKSAHEGSIVIRA